MDLKKLPFSDSSPRRKVVVSGFGLGVAASFIFVCILLLNYSFKSPFVTPVFTGFSYSDNNNSNSTLISWPFSFSNASVSLSSKASHNVENGNFSVQETKKIDESGIFSNLGEKGEILGNTHVLNFSENVKNESFLVQESGIVKKTHGSEIDGNGTVLGILDSTKYNVTSTYIKDVVRSSGGDRKKVAVGEGKGGLSVEKNGVLFQSDGELLIRRDKDFYGDCDVYDGEWVRDDTKPYYPPGSCPIIDRDFDCHLNKRPDDEYIKWRWQPYACDIPSLNATDFLERLRGQKLVFVGDSLNRNMWESLVCILRHSIRDKKRVYEISGRHEFKKKGFYAFRFEDYNCSVDFVSSPFLVRQSTFKGKNGSFETLRLDLMDKTTSMYSDADIVIFNTGHWWTHEKTSRGEDYYQEGNHVHGRLKVLEAYKRAISTWARWVDQNFGGSRTQVIFRGYSVTHFRGGPWNSGGQCHKETEPIFKKAYLAKYPSKMKVLHHVLHNMTTPVIYMNISRLTDYRKDGHPSIYRKEYKTVEKQMAGVHSQDCSHWCLPGVPDTWNELLYASLLKSRKGSWKN
ncbi:protein trichome birefringence-like 2 [Solanum verrucosum]|uniref:protein trichome birefringence-like 2 n=1 Tax=Solanum verrucosum TaxID=315347 RepID=UPI0020D11C79|nr:protein trichome birefringence-like 2 [Solanum verrucosum]